MALGTSLPARPVVSSGTSYYVDNASGNDTTGTGATGTPWATIQKAINTVAAGSRIKVRTGTGVYAEALLFAGKVNASTVTIEPDTGHEWTFKVYNFWIEDSKFYRFNNIEFDGSLSSPSGSGYLGGCNIKPNVAATSDIELYGCFFHDHGHAIPVGANSCPELFLGGSGGQLMTGIHVYNSQFVNPGSTILSTGSQSLPVSTFNVDTSTPTNVPEIYYGLGVAINGTQSIAGSTITTKSSSWGSKILSASGKVVINGQEITYTGSTNDGTRTTSLTGCTGGSGSATDGTPVYGGPGVIHVYNDAGNLQAISFTGRGLNKFTGCSGGTGTVSASAVVTDSNRNEDHGIYISETAADDPAVLIANCISRDTRNGFGYQVYPESKGTWIVNSIAYGCTNRSGFIISQESANACSDNRIYNCISMRNDLLNGTAGYRFSNLGGGASPVNVVNNCIGYDNPSGNFDADVAGALTTSGKITSDPLFTNITHPSVLPPSSSLRNPSTRNFALLAGSPAINAGVDTFTPTFDFNGTTRTQADIGPFAYAPAAPSPVSMIRSRRPNK